MLVQRRVNYVQCNLCHGTIFEIIDNDGKKRWCIDCGGNGKKGKKLNNQTYSSEESNEAVIEAVSHLLQF